MPDRSSALTNLARLSQAAGADKRKAGEPVDGPRAVEAEEAPAVAPPAAAAQPVAAAAEPAVAPSVELPGPRPRRRDRPTLSVRIRGDQKDWLEAKRAEGYEIQDLVEAGIDWVMQAFEQEG